MPHNSFNSRICAPFLVANHEDKGIFLASSCSLCEASLWRNRKPNKSKPAGRRKRHRPWRPWCCGYQVSSSHFLKCNTAALFANVHGTPLSLLTLAGHSGAEVSEKGENAMTDFALDWISGVFGSRAKKAVSRAHATSWSKDPWALGAFSSAPPGAQEARKALSESLNDVVWFAGEAVHQTFSGTVGGAWQDGERAADAVIARLDHKPLRSAGG